RLEPTWPLIDKGFGVVDLVAELWRAGRSETPAAWGEATREVLDLVGRAAGPAAMLARELEAWISNPRHDPDFTTARERHGALWRRGMRRAAGASRILITGHTHH